MPSFMSETNSFAKFLSGAITLPGSIIHEEVSHQFEYSLLGITIAILVIILVFAYNNFVTKERVAPLKEEEFKPGFRLLYKKYYVDELYDKMFVQPLYWLSDMFYRVIDIKVLDGSVNSVGKGIVSGSRVIRLIQTGSVGFYIFAMVLGIIVMLLLNLY